MDVTIRNAVPADEAAVIRMWAAARARLAAEKIPQWQDAYPGAADFQTDLITGAGQVAVLATGEVVGYAALMPSPEPTYARIAGQWLTAGAYITIHRFVVSNQHLHHGIGQQFMTGVLAHIQTAGTPAVRVDTHAKNTPMHHLLGHFAFQHTGTIWMTDGSPRDAYELVF
ncbi:GNAT family N-acetyltransferase [Schleiferilactobacillus harbinensis]|jgi:GNAT superfamily N-acetyltransferase|uniref:N-acetyltransferase domain-containing protein n=1 Tax=Schleiferilactobacillus harbinensis DSM 16991 TaxID=1122147 RepID=A0A0R1XES1_9LACO|nr:GNAT family N-acetyltransferase [Schleiferilactobacillus harbinensis]HAY53946.1 GNAT family N-acetyltransferase [Lactobacillus sp.]KRM28514.1 hypothetical protein FC91_GL001979 [Schleiferilactobacillus harbinensis DSM 16991]MCI1686966.1 GNAT family N-acetyltransferase [Schleiferilactobacillus harbinensis]MCI1783351.1 GNAT family N-acetyltransferase [Schleiferilactobacillus harbinensis]MCI1851965.1 GNAT family N-acetyltransferase [Schleiferilactobacillus harbinensis]